MKGIIIATLLIFIFTACRKENDIVPAPLSQAQKQQAKAIFKKEINNLQPVPYPGNDPDCGLEQVVIVMINYTDFFFDASTGVYYFDFPVARVSNKYIVSVSLSNNNYSTLPYRDTPNNITYSYRLTENAIRFILSVNTDKIKRLALTNNIPVQIKYKIDLSGLQDDW